ncbi:hypothetical protein [Paraburkholderia sp. J7]|uniref:hypothetical protein n=1 Tax=Paraburkholderia sp. J7 TaxID=2805438 RepID=UPI002AB5ECF1|nr:hypothetical protein [Paraburkholderia sp. J7]
MSESSFDERMARHREMLAAAGFSRVSFFLCAEARRNLAALRQRGESQSAVLNRLLRANVCARNETPQEAREFARRVQRARNEILHSLRPSNVNGPYITRCWVLRPDGSGCYVTADDVQEFDKDSRPP